MERWRELMVAKLYDEATPEEIAELDAAIAADPELAAEWQALGETRAFMRGHAAELPEPQAPRVLVFTERSRKITPLGLATGLAASLLLVAVGWLAADRPPAVEPLDADAGIELDTADAVLEALNRIEELEQQNAALEQRARRLAASSRTFNPTTGKSLALKSPNTLSLIR